MNNKIKSFDYGKKLFADPYYKPSRSYSNDKYLKYLKNIYHEFELNTSDEKRAFKEIYDYFKNPDNLISKEILENLLLLKSKFPNILDPIYDELYNSFISNINFYRGGSLNIKQISNLLFEREKEYNNFKLNKAILKNYKYIYEGTGKKHYLSFSKNFDTALEFALSPFQNKNILKKFIDSNRIPVIIGISGNDENLILNPDFSDAVSPFYEDEVLHISNKIKAKEIYIINANEILSYYEKFDFNKNNKFFRDNLKYKII